LERLERAFIDVVAMTGVDVNQCVLHNHLSSTLQFVSGLGPRKAQSILTKIAMGVSRIQSFFFNFSFVDNPEKEKKIIRV